jgi:hypothetical protein
MEFSLCLCRGVVNSDLPSNPRHSIQNYVQCRLFEFAVGFMISF